MVLLPLLGFYVSCTSGTTSTLTDFVTTSGGTPTALDCGLHVMPNVCVLWSPLDLILPEVNVPGVFVMVRFAPGSNVPVKVQVMAYSASIDQAKLILVP